MHRRPTVPTLIKVLPVVVALGLGACGETGAPPGSAPPVPSGEVPAQGAPVAGGENLARCGATGLVPYVGQPLVLRGQPVPDHGGYLSWEDLPRLTRVVRPGEMVTMDHVPERLTIRLDDDGVIRRLTCG